MLKFILVLFFLLAFSSANAGTRLLSCPSLLNLAIEKSQPSIPYLVEDTSALFEHLKEIMPVPTTPPSFTMPIKLLGENIFPSEEQRAVVGWRLMLLYSLPDIDRIFLNYNKNVDLEVQNLFASSPDEVRVSHDLLTLYTSLNAEGKNVAYYAINTRDSQGLFWAVDFFMLRAADGNIHLHIMCSRFNNSKSPSILSNIGPLIRNLIEKKKKILIGGAVAAGVGGYLAYNWLSVKKVSSPRPLEESDTDPEIYPAPYEQHMNPFED